MNYFKRFIQWQNYVHYILLGLIYRIIIFYISISPYAPPSKPLYFKSISFLLKSIFSLDTLYVIGIIFIVDSIIHGIFYILPQKYRWRD